MQTIPEILKKYPGALLSLVITHATIIIPDVDEAGATFAPAPGVEAGPYFEKEYLPLIASGVLVPESEGSTYFVLAKAAGGTVDEVLRLMSEAPGRELLITAESGAYIFGPFNSFVAGPFETEDFKTLIDDGVLIESGRRQNTFVFNPQPPDFSDFDLSPSHPVNVYSTEDQAEIFSQHLRTGMCACFGGFATNFFKEGDQANG